MENFFFQCLATWIFLPLYIYLLGDSLSLLNGVHVSKEVIPHQACLRTHDTTQVCGVCDSCAGRKRPSFVALTVSGQSPSVWQPSHGMFGVLEHVRQFEVVNSVRSTVDTAKRKWHAVKNAFLTKYHAIRMNSHSLCLVSG